MEDLSRNQRKSKVIAGLLAFLVPGLGHFYLGLMQKGLMMMLMLILDICAIVYFAAEEQNVPLLIILFSLFIPVIFFDMFYALTKQGGEPSPTLTRSAASRASAHARFHPVLI